MLLNNEHLNIRITNYEVGGCLKIIFPFYFAIRCSNVLLFYCSFQESKG